MSESLIPMRGINCPATSTLHF